MASVALHVIDRRRLDFDTAWERLDDAERARAGRFVFDRDRRRWTVFRAEAKRLLAAHLGRPLPDWREETDGKPFLAGRPVEFNLTHGERFAALVISEHGPVGVDLEPLARGRDLLDAAAAFCHPDELAGLPVAPDARADRLIRIWTAKEAFLKALGAGLTQPPREIRLRGDRADGPPAGLADYHLLRPTLIADHALAAAVPHDVTRFS
jgi:4'-phosphopantetheinyl transferase